MEQKKSRRADLERWRPIFFVAGLVMPLLLFLVALEYRTLAEPEIDMSSLMDDVSKENEYIPVPSPERTDMAAAAHAKPKKPDTQQLKVVDHKTPVNRLDNIAQSRNESEEGDEGNGGEKAEGDTKTTPQPIAVDMGDNPLNFRIVEQLPEFPGGMSAFVKWLTDNLKYPYSAQSQKIKGRVVVTFIVNRDGTTSDLKVSKSAHPILDREALRVMRMMPRWKPGVANNRPCRTMMAIPVEFAL